MPNLRAYLFASEFRINPAFRLCDTRIQIAVKTAPIHVPRILASALLLLIKIKQSKSDKPILIPVIMNAIERFLI